ncbi:hypothetical protein BT63DRAFT_462626 [Microthyrium microscopicum]|uniref:Uncharacterized protein n=1 Tax=Microthyrium microscopicum TaxID=703497 RepID=A0A6A6US75_9PEZI|nr:hypothetical protein BT63DRAFT_462626 [Microthyrium microscopicum]
MRSSSVLAALAVQSALASPLNKRDPQHPASASGGSLDSMVHGATAFTPSVFSGNTTAILESLKAMFGGAASFVPSLFSDSKKAATSAMGSLAPADSPGTSGMLSMSSIMSAAAYLLPSQAGTVQTKEGKMRPGSKRAIIKYGPYELPAYKKPTGSKPEGGHAHGGASGDKGGMGGMDMGGPKSGTWEGLVSLLQTMTGNKPMDPNGLGFIKRLSSGVCKDCTVLAGKMNVISENGTVLGVADGVYVHHAVTMDVSKPVTQYITGCTGDPAAAFNPFIGAGVDDFTQYYTTKDAKFNSGFYVKDDTFLMQVELVNYKEVKQQVYLQMDMEYMPGKVGNDASQAVLSATKCGSLDLGFKPKAGEAGQIESQDFPVNVDGTVIASRGHMHDGGTSVNMLLNGKVVCTSKAIYGSTANGAGVDGKEWQTITKMEECEAPIPVKKGDTVKITATYDMKQHPARESNGEGQEVMGIMTYVFVPKA